MKAITSGFKLYIALAVLFIAFSAKAVAQDKLAQGTKAVTDMMKGQLLLNEAQYAKVYDINLAFFTKAKAIRQSGAGRMAKGKSIKALDAARDAKLKVILTGKQFALFLEKKKENREKFKEYIEENKQ